MVIECQVCLLKALAGHNFFDLLRKDWLLCLSRDWSDSLHVTAILCLTLKKFLTKYILFLRWGIPPESFGAQYMRTFFFVCPSLSLSFAYFMLKKIVVTLKKKKKTLDFFVLVCYTDILCLKVYELS